MHNVSPVVTFYNNIDAIRIKDDVLHRDVIVNSTFNVSSSHCPCFIIMLIIIDYTGQFSTISSIALN